MKIKLLLILLTPLIINGIFSIPAHAQEYSPAESTQRNYEGVIETVATDTSTSNQTIDVKITNGDKANQTVSIYPNPNLQSKNIEYKKGDKVLILEVEDPVAAQSTYYITDFNRTGSLLWLFIIFCIVVLLVSRKRGFYSLLGMAYSFFVIFKFILPQLLKGSNPLLIAVGGAALIAPVTFYLSHGTNRKTTVALASTIISLSITGLLALLFTNISKLTGFGSDEVFFLQIAKEGVINIKGLFLAGIIIGTLGILDDVTISQSAIVHQLKNSVRGIDNWELFKKAMAVGHDHIASTVNTLVLVYTGAALPLLLLFINSTQTFNQAINAEIIADEVVRTLVGSIGLVLAVPISTVLAVYFGSSETEVEHKGHWHSH